MTGVTLLPQARQNRLTASGPECRKESNSLSFFVQRKRTFRRSVPAVVPVSYVPAHSTRRVPTPPGRSLRWTVSAGGELPIDGIGHRTLTEPTSTFATSDSGAVWVSRTGAAAALAFAGSKDGH